VLAILAATLRPGAGESYVRELACVFCGSPATADALTNIILFLPLGVGLALGGTRSWRSLLRACALSAGVEFVQLFLPGREPSVGDVITNTLGAAVGMAAVRAAHLWVRPSAPVRRALALAASGACVFAFTGTGILLRPSFPRSEYFGQWTPNLAHLEWYRGRVQSATLGPMTVPSTRVENSDSARALLVAGAPLTVRARLGPPVPALGSLFSIADDRLREIVLLGPDRGDLVFRYRTLADEVGLDRPDLRVRGLMTLLRPSDTVTIEVRRREGDTCVRVDARVTCGLGFGLSQGWALLMYPESLPRWLESLLGKAWMAGLLLPLGFWFNREVPSVTGGALGFAAAAVLPLATGMRPTAPLDFLAAVAGLWAGMLLRRAALRGFALREGSADV
jgi:hypothetical protein